MKGGGGVYALERAVVWRDVFFALREGERDLGKVRRAKIPPPFWRGCRRRYTMEKPRIRHIALNVQNRDELAEFYKRVFGLEEKYRGPNGTIYLSDGHVGVALISRPDIPWGINHFGFQVEDVPA